jgi:hypothetical protein
LSKGVGAAIGGIGNLVGGAMSKGSSKPPPTPDPMAMAAAQSQSNLQTAQTQSLLNNINTYSPWGSTVYSQMPSGQWNLQQTLSDPLQQLYNTQLGSTQFLSNLANNMAVANLQPMLATGGYLSQLGANIAPGLATSLGPLGNMPLTQLSPASFMTNVTGGAGGQPLPGVQTALPGAGQGIPTAAQGMQMGVAGAGQGIPSPTAGVQTGVGGAGQGIQGQVGPAGNIQMGLSPQSFGQQIQQAQNAAYQAQTQYLDPQYKQQEESLTQRLADQGIEEGSDAHSRAMGDFNRQKQMAYQSAQNSAVEAGNQLQQQLFTQQLQGGQFANAAQAQQYVQQLQDAGFVNEAQAQNFNQQIQAGGFANQAAAQLFGQGLQAQGQGYQQALAGGQFANQAQQQAWAQQLAGQGQNWQQLLQAAQFGQAAQQQMFGQGLNLADLYNQAVLGAAGQQNTAAQLGLAQAQAQQQAPITAMNAIMGAGQGLLGAGYQGLTQGAGLENLAPTWPLSIPQLGGTPTNVQPTNIANLQTAGTQAALGANTIRQQNMATGLMGANTLANMWQGGNAGIGGLFGGGGLKGMFNLGGGGAAGIPGFYGPWGAGSNLAGMGLGIPGIPD